MKKAAIILLLGLASASASMAQLAVVAASDHDILLRSADPKLAQNKRLVYDFWREVFEAGQLKLADKYLTESYIQHNPNVPTGRAAFVDFFGKFKQPKAIQAKVEAPLVAITAEGNLVILSFVRTQSEPKETDSSKKYTTTWFDMFRIEDGKIAEHWDPAEKQ